LSSERGAVEYLILTIGVIGIYVYVGGSGIVSFGHVGYMAVGGYISAILSIPPSIRGSQLEGLPSWMAEAEPGHATRFALAALAGAIVAAAFGLLIWRLTALAAAISTLAFLLIVYVVASGWEDVTGGRGAVPGVARLASLSYALPIVIVAIFVAAWFQRSRGGRMLRAVRDDVPAARSLGIAAESLTWRSMVVSGAFMGVMGALYVHLVGSVSPDFFYLGMTLELLAMLVIGGMRSLTGAVIGATVVRALRELLAPLDEGFSVGSLGFDGRPGTRLVALSVVLLVVLVRRPAGITAGLEIAMARFGRNR
jgi:branched-chain amino acid transport system permease protein